MLLREATPGQVRKGTPGSRCAGSPGKEVQQRVAGDAVGKRPGSALEQQD